MKKLLGILTVISLFAITLTGCGEKEVNSDNVVENQPVVETSENVDTTVEPENDESVEEISDEEYAIQVALQYYFADAFGEEVNDARVREIKIYSAEEREAIESLKDLSEDDIVFDVHYELHPAEGVDVNKFTAGTGDYDEESGWIVEKYNCGYASKNEDGEYRIVSMGTGF